MGLVKEESINHRIQISKGEEELINKFADWLKCLNYSDRTIELYTKAVKRIFKIFGRMLTPDEEYKLTVLKNSGMISEHTLHVMRVVIYRFNEFMNTYHNRIDSKIVKEFMKWLEGKYPDKKIAKTYQSYAKMLIRHFGYIPRENEIYKVYSLPYSKETIKQLRVVIYRFEDYLTGGSIKRRKGGKSFIFEEEFKEWLESKGYTYTTYTSSVNHLIVIYNKGVKMFKRGVKSTKDIDELYKNHHAKYKNKLKHSFKLFCEFLKEVKGIELR